MKKDIQSKNIQGVRTYTRSRNIYRERHMKKKHKKT